MTSTTAVPTPSFSIRGRTATHRSWRLSSLALITLPWLILYLGGIFTPGLLDDVDSVYLEIAREMLLRHDYVTPFVDGIRFFDKPPLMYWLAAGSMHIFGVHDWAARLPLAIGVLALLFAIYALGIRLFAGISPAHAPDRGGLYAALAMALSIGPYLFTRFYIPDILIALWMTLAVHLFLIALDRARESRITNTPSSRPVTNTPSSRPLTNTLSSRPLTNTLSSRPLTKALSSRPVTNTPSSRPLTKTLSSRPEHGEAVRSGEIPVFRPDHHETGAPGPSGTRVHSTSHTPLLPMLGFAAVVALSVLTKGLIGLVFPVAFAILYLALTRRFALVRNLSIIPATLAFIAIAAPWHILAALRNPAIAMPAGVGLPQKAGWAWFYLYNEHVARFLGRRIPHDYGQVPIPLFWLLLVLWLFPWAAFLPSAIIAAVRQLRSRVLTHSRVHEASLALLLWAGIILGFFTLSSRQEYYHLPALPALALLVGALLAAADRDSDAARTSNIATPVPFAGDAARHTLRSSLYGLVPVGTLLFLVCGYFAIAAPRPAAGTTLNQLLSSNPALYNLSLGHIFDLTGNAMGFFRWPLTVVAISALLLGPGQHLIRAAAAGKTSPAAGKQQRTLAANLLIAVAGTGMLLAAHEGYVRFNPILGSKDIALALNARKHPGDLILIDGELTSGSSLIFYTREPALLVNGRVNGPWFGSFWPDAPHLFLTDADLTRLWSGPHRVFLLTYNPAQRQQNLAPAAPVHDLADSGGKTLLSNRK